MNCKKSILSLGWYHEVYHNFSTPTPRQQDANTDYPQSRRKAKGLCLFKGQFRQETGDNLRAVGWRNARVVSLADDQIDREIERVEGL